MVLGPFFINYLKQRKIRELAQREDCPNLAQFHAAKEGTPTMGGIFIIGSVLISVLLWADLTNRYIIITFLTCLYFAILGYVDDYVKLTKKKNRTRGLSARIKFLWQLIPAIAMGLYIYSQPEMTSTISLPFIKHVFDLGLFYIIFISFVIVGASNSVNLTDGLDGLAIGCILIVSSTLAVLSYLTGHLNFSQYLFIPYVAGAGELSVFCAAITGASLGFLWFNCHPASIFMGDTGSLSLGGTIGVISVLIKKELLLVLLGGVFVIEALSVILQVSSFKIRKKRIFKISPLHHHFQLCGWHESKIIIRFWILGIIFAMLTLMTLKVR